MASGKGSNAEAIVKFSQKQEAHFEVALIVTNNPTAGVIDIAQQYGIDWYCLKSNQLQTEIEYEDCILKLFEKYQISMVALAGYLKLIPSKIIDTYPKRIFNIHPSLLPKYGGIGMYGSRVHKIVIENREQKSGSSVHIVERDYDTGEIICQKSIDIYEDDTAETLSERIQTLEYSIYAPTLNLQAEQILQGI
ncbi:MAG: phosphoribosylglycinamide formyltransferase [Ignavibacteria bacterium]|nr:phosphoribosylglycinamide formyltransferase [Ignavibacteria bacterium]